MAHTERHVSGDVAAVTAVVHLSSSSAVDVVMEATATAGALGQVENYTELFKQTRIACVAEILRAFAGDVIAAVHQCLV